MLLTTVIKYWKLLEITLDAYSFSCTKCRINGMFDTVQTMFYILQNVLILTSRRVNKSKKTHGPGGAFNCWLRPLNYRSHVRVNKMINHGLMVKILDNYQNVCILDNTKTVAAPNNCLIRKPHGVLYVKRNKLTKQYPNNTCELFVWLRFATAFFYLVSNLTLWSAHGSLLQRVGNNIII